MNESVSKQNPPQSKSVWLIRVAWISIGAIIVWALLSFFVFKPQNVSLLHLIIWGQLMVASVGLFIAGFVLSFLDFWRLRKSVDITAKRVLRRRMLWSLPGLLLALLLVGLLIFLIISVAGALFTVR